MTDLTTRAGQVEQQTALFSRHQFMLDQYRKGVSIEEIADELGHTCKHVRKILVWLGETISHGNAGRHDSIWEMDENARRIAFARRAQRGARRTLGKRIEAKPVPEQAQPARLLVIAKNMPNWKRIIREVAFKHNIGVKDMMSRSRAYHIVAARNEAMWRMRTEISMSFPQIAAKFDRDHTTVIHGCKQHAQKQAVPALSTEFTEQSENTLTQARIDVAGGSGVVIKEITSTNASPTHG